MIWGPYSAGGIGSGGELRFFVGFFFVGQHAQGRWVGEVCEQNAVQMVDFMQDDAGLKIGRAEANGLAVAVQRLDRDVVGAAHDPAQAGNG